MNDNPLYSFEPGKLYVRPVPAGGALDEVLGSGLAAGFVHAGYITEDGITLEVSDEERPLLGDDKIVRTCQARREVSFAVRLERPEFPRVPQWPGLVPWQADLFRQWFGSVPTPAPTVRSAAVDLWDALRLLLGLVWAAVRNAAGRAGDAVLDVAFGAVDAVWDRWDALRAPYHWRRLPAPVIRYWSVFFDLVHQERGKPERVHVWLRRLAAHVWKALRHG